VERSCVPMNKNRIEGVVEQGERAKQRVRKLTRRSGGRSLEQVVERLRSYVLGWKAYFRLADTPGVWKELDQWIRHRMRAIQLKQWRRGTTAYRELLARGARPDVALLVAGNMRRLWRNSGTPLNGVLDLSWAVGYPPSLLTSTPRTAGCGPACPVVWQGRADIRSPYTDRRGRKVLKFGDYALEIVRLDGRD